MSKFIIDRIEKENWAHMSSSAHLISFGERHLSHEDRIDYALMIVDEESFIPAGYMTIKEMDSKTAYIQHGGALPEHKGTVHVLKRFMQFTKYLTSQYDYVWMRVDTKNFPMLKIAMRTGFEIVGTYFHAPKLFLELKLNSRQYEG